MKQTNEVIYTISKMSNEEGFKFVQFVTKSRIVDRDDLKKIQYIAEGNTFNAIRILSKDVSELYDCAVLFDYE